MYLAPRPSRVRSSSFFVITRRHRWYFFYAKFHVLQYQGIIFINFKCVQNLVQYWADVFSYNPAELIHQPQSCCNAVCAFCIFWEHCPWIVLRKRVGIKPLLIDKLSSILIPQDGTIAPEGFVLLPIVDPFINKGPTINMTIIYQYDDQLPISRSIVVTW